MTIRQALVLGFAAVALIGCGQTAVEQAEPGATPSTATHEIEGSNSPSDLDPFTAQQWVDRVHLGRGLDPDGKVPEALQTDRFAGNDEIWVSMEVTDAPVGSKIRLTVQDSDSNEHIWSDEKVVQAGKSHLDFSIGENLEPGEYQAQVVVGDERVANRTFHVG